MKNLTTIVLGAMLLAVPVPGAHAQSWFDKGSDLLKGFGGGSEASGALSNSDIASGLVEALKVGTERVVSTLGKTDGFNKSPDVHIPLPGTLAKVTLSARTSREHEPPHQLDRREFPTS